MTNVTQTNHNLEHAFQQVVNSASFMRTLRQQHFAAFLQQGWPTRNLENWKYTDLRELAKQSFHLGEAAFISSGTLAPYLLPNSHHLVFINGCFAPELSTTALTENLVLTNLASAWQDYPELIKLHGHSSAHSSLQDLNLALMKDGAFIYVPKNTSVKLPIQLVFYTQGDQSMQHIRNTVFLEENAQATLLETYVAEKNTPYLNNIHTQIILSPHARLNYYKNQVESDQAYHLAMIQVKQQANSYFNSYSFSLGAKLSRDDLQISLDQSQASCRLQGLYLIASQQHHDHHTRIDHHVPHCQSEQLYKGVLQTHATGVFNGKVVVHPQAQRTQAKQRNQNLLLAKTAVMNTKPELEIYADDVQCTHGATVGQLDEAALFYFRSRGISETQALSMLTRAFANEIVDNIEQDGIKQYIEQGIKKKL